MNPESFLARLIAWLLWPFHYLLDKLDRVGRRSERMVDERDIEADERRLERRWSFNLAAIFRRLTWWLFYPIYLLLEGIDRLGHIGRPRESTVNEREVSAEERRINRRLARRSLRGSFLERWFGRIVWPFFWLVDSLSRVFRRESFLGRWFGRIVWPFFWLVDSISLMSLRESFLGRLLGWIVWPFFWLVDSLDRMGRRKEHAVDEKQLKAEQERISRRQTQEIRAKAQIEALKGTWVSRIGSVALAPIFGGADFLWQFFASRRLSLWLWSLPILVSLGLLACVFMFTQFGNDPRVVVRYEAALSQAIKANDQEKIKLYRLKLAQLGSSTHRGEYQTALSLAGRGELAEAYEIMKKLTPVGQPGFEGAHFWIAQNLIEGRLDVPEPENLILAVKHLERLRSRTGDQPEIRLLEGLAYAGLGQIPAAVNALSPIANSNVVASFVLMEIFSAQGQQAEARIQALNVHRQLTQAENQGETLNEDQRKWLTAATAVIGDAKLAASAVEQWYRANPDSVEARVHRARILLQEVITWSRKPTQSEVEKMYQNLAQAAATVPIEQADMLTGIAHSIGTSRKQNDVMEALYQRLLSDEKLSGIIIESFGTLAALDQDWKTAHELLLRATTISPELGNAWNNLAYVISVAFPDRLEEGMRYADKAVTLNPNNPDYRETRGMIYYKLGNYELAVADLEIAANGVNELASVHAALADSHRRLGNNSLAELYEQQLRRRR